MIILGIETSCDETALSIIEIDGAKNLPPFEVKILANNVLSQIEIHKQYGGVFPNLAKREHGRNLIPLMEKTLKESGFGNSKSQTTNSKWFGEAHHPEFAEGQIPNHKLEKILSRETELLKQFLEFIPTIQKPPIDLIAVTAGPGLEPALWVGINFAKALSVAWNIPAVAVNHMEGHILVSLLKRNEEKHKSQITNPKQIQNSNFQTQNTMSYTLNPIPFPALSLLISGGHTEMVLIKDWLSYEIVGKTRDDAVGEAFDKVARILGLPYPGGPEISRLAEETRKTKLDSTSKSEKRLNLVLPRPMLHSPDLDFSFSGLKTAVLYLVKKLPAPLDEKTKTEIAREFENAVTEVLAVKIKKAIETYGVKTLILGGGVVANKHIRAAFEKLTREFGIILKLPAIDHATDNALMIAVAGYFNKTRALSEKTGLLDVKANGNLHF